MNSSYRNTAYGLLRHGSNQRSSTLKVNKLAIEWWYGSSCCLDFGICVSNSVQFGFGLNWENKTMKSNLYIRYINSIPNTRQTSKWAFFYLQSNMTRSIISIVHIVDISCHNQINCHFPVIGGKCDTTFLRIKYHSLLLYVVYTLIWWIALEYWLGYLYCLGTRLSNYSTRSNTFHWNRCRNWYYYFVSFQYLAYILFGLCRKLCMYNDKDVQMKDN